MLNCSSLKGTFRIIAATTTTEEIVQEEKSESEILHLMGLQPDGCFQSCFRNADSIYHTC
jgi:hypothetical protein